MSEPFYVQRRLKELKHLIAGELEFDHEGAMGKTLIDFLDELTAMLAAQAGSREAEAYDFIMRALGYIGWLKSEQAFDARGYVNPFKPLPKPAAVPVLSGKPSWDWPVIYDPPTASKGGAFNADFRQYSALKMFGYAVGNKGRDEGWIQRKRQQFLSDFMEMSLPPIVAKTFGDQYGEPMSTTRLRKVANVIASNASNFARRRDPSYDLAIGDWEADLSFLEREHYHGNGLKFEPWPKVEWDKASIVQGRPKIESSTDKQRRALAKFRAQSLGGSWDLRELLVLIPLITGRDKECAIHLAAVEGIKHAEKFGDCLRVAELVRITPARLHGRLQAWLRNHSPVEFQLSRKGFKAHIAKSADGHARPFLIDRARITPI